MTPEDEEAFKVRLTTLVDKDVQTLIEKGRSYGDSWKKRGGVGAYMMMCRKFDRIENITKNHGWDIFTGALDVAADTLDDIADLRRYLLLVEDHVRHSLEEAEKARTTVVGTVVFPSGIVARRTYVDTKGRIMEFDENANAWSRIVPEPLPSGMRHPFGFDEKLDVPGNS